MLAPPALLLDARMRHDVGRIEQQRPGHPQVHNQMDLVLERPVEVLAPTFQRRHRATHDRVRDRLGRERRAPAGIGDRHRGDARPHQDGLEAAPDRLDLG